MNGGSAEVANIWSAVEVNVESVGSAVGANVESAVEVNIRLAEKANVGPLNLQ